MSSACVRDEGGGKRRRKGVAEPAMALRVRAFIIMIILDIPCPKQGQRASQPASQPAKLSLLSFPILILFLPGRSGRHISRSGHKIHSPFQSPLPPPRPSHPLRVRGKRDGDRAENYPCSRVSLHLLRSPIFHLVLSSPFSPPPSSLPVESNSAGFYY